MSQPSLHSWAEEPLRLLEQTVAKDDPDPKALACYGLFLRATECDTEELWLRFADGRPVSAITIPFLADCCERLAARGKTAVFLVWDNAPWHGSKAVRSWIREQNRRVKREGQGCASSSVPCRSRAPG